MQIITFPGYTDSTKIENPYQSLLYTEILSESVVVDDFTANNIFKKKYDIIHIHWPESNRLSKKLKLALTYSFGFLFLISIAKLKGAKLVWTVHNLKPHENKWPTIQKLHFAIFTWMVNGLIVMNNYTITQVCNYYKNLAGKPARIIKHGNYKRYYLNTVNKEDAKALLKIEEGTKVCLFFGQLRAYKGLEELITVFQTIPDQNFLLLIVGSIRKSDGDYGEKLRNLITSDTVILKDEFIKNNDIQLYMNAADVVILPYKNILNSGALLLALSFNKPVILPLSPSVEEFQQEYGDNWICTYKKLEPDTITRFVNERKDDGAQILDMSDSDWKLIAERTIDFFNSLVKNSL